MTVMLAWALPYFAVTGAFHTKFLRYMAPLLPFLLVFGAARRGRGLSLAGSPVGQRRAGSRGARCAVVAAASRSAGRLAFAGVYRQEHPWIQASAGSTQHPEGAKLLTEHWDDALPLTLDELPGPAAAAELRARRAAGLGRGHAPSSSSWRRSWRARTTS